MLRVSGWLCSILVCLSAPLAAASGRAIVVQLPGASGAELEALWRDGALDAGGFRPFFERGRVTTDLVPADPSQPFASAVALATGAPPGASGVVAERQTAADGTVEEVATARGLAGGGETLWSVAAAAGRTVGAVLWPGLDNRGETSRASWGIADRDTEHYPSRSFRLKVGDWVDEKYGQGPGPSLYWGLPPQVKCYSPAVSVSAQFAMQHSQVDLIYTLVAIDRTDDGKVNYDGVLISSKIDPKKGFVGIAEPGTWFRIDLEQPSGDRRSTPETAWVKVMTLAPDLSRATIYISSSRFIKAYPSALVRKLEQEGIAWTGRPDEAAFIAGRDTGFGLDETSYAETAGRLAHFAVDVALAGERLYPTDLLLLSLPVFDPIDRQLLLVDPRQPGFGEARSRRYAAARRTVWAAVDRELARLLSGVDLASTTVFLVSPYANLPVEADVDVGELLRQAPELARVAPSATRTWRSVIADGGIAHVRLSVAGRDQDGELDAAAARAAARAVRDVLARARDGEAPIFARVLLREEADRQGLDRPESGDVLAFANPGYRLLDLSKDVVPVTRHPDVLAAAGYWSALPASRGFLLTLGRGAGRARVERGVEAVEVTRRVAGAVGIKSPKRPR